MKIKTRPVNKKRIPKCPKCGRRDWRRKGLTPTNPQATYRHPKGGTTQSSKGWRGSHHPKYHQSCVDRLFSKRYVCKHCGTGINYGNAGRPIC